MANGPPGEQASSDERYLIKTEFGDVLVTVNPAADSGLAADLLTLEAPTAENSRDIAMEVPLRAFAAKMLELVERVGVAETTASATMRTMLVREKATADLKRIERWARSRAKG